jgi:hypothetical protein
MELWEGAILVVGGIWLIGRVSRQSPNHPVTAALNASSSLQSAGATPGITLNPPSTPSLETGDQMQSTGGLVAGEPLETPLPTVANLPTPPTQAQPKPAPVRVGMAPSTPRPVGARPLPPVNPVPVKTNPPWFGTARPGGRITEL